MAHPSVERRVTNASPFGRRAKEKLKASKAAATSVSINIENGDHDERDDDDEVSPDSEQTQLLPEPEHGSLSPPLDPPTQQLSPGHQLSSAQIMSMRRPSLPGVSQVDNVIPANFDPLARRRSVDPNLLRYATNPYARPSHLSRVPGRPSPYPARPNPMHRPSMPSLHTAGQPMQISEHALYSPRGSLPDNSLYMAQARPLASPIPGPLPQPGFSFGAASSTVSPGSAGSSERNSPDSLQQYSFPGDRPQLPDFDEDDSTYGGQTSRFGSITSVASGDSAYFSDVAEMYPAGFVPDHRRGSRLAVYLSFHFMLVLTLRLSTSSHHHYLGNMMSNLDVNAQSGRRFSLPTSEMQQIQSYSPHTTNGPGPDFQHPQTAYAQSPPDHAPYPQPTSDQPTYPQQAGEQEPQQIHYSPRPADSPAGIGLGGGGGSPSINSSGDGSSYYYSPSASATPESQYTQTTPDPGAALPNMSIPSYTDLPEFAPSMPSQQKYDVPELRAPPTIVPATTGGCYDPLSYDQERSLYPAPTVLPNQLAGYSW